MTDAPSANIRACPPWCSDEPGHPYTDNAVDGGYVARYHEDAEALGEVVPAGQSASFSGFAGSPISTTISCEEQAVDDNGPAVQSPARIFLWAENPAFTAEEARAVAALLCRAADRVEALTAGCAL